MSTARPPGDDDPRHEDLPTIDATRRARPVEEEATIGSGGIGSGGTGPVDRAEPRQPAGHVGRYRIVGKLGEGGMGVVYEAEQDSPRRRVALKLIRGGVFADELRLRLFQREAETLARLEHPNIAAIYDAGTTDDGQHFFAMELVRGRTLDEWLRSRGDAGAPGELEARLRLFRVICDAVHYAHQRGVIHRDIKPGNVLVTDDTATGAAAPFKILDFGLARITDGNAADASVATEVGVVKGTLPYMSPEQARGEPHAIDTRTDVYALGVVLYEMIAGKRPIDVSTTSLVDAVRAICETQPLPLSKAWTGARRLDADLETIVGKALAKVPAERYASAAALGEDVERFLTSQPILARPPSTMYQLRKLVMRRKAPFAAAATGVVMLVAFGVGMSVLYARSERNLRRALDAEEQAAANFSMAQGAVDRYFTQVSESPDLRAHGLERLRRDLLATAREFYEGFAARQAGDPALRAGLGTTHLRLASMNRIVGDNDGAERAGLEGVRVFEELVGEHPGERSYIADLSTLASNLGLTYYDTSRFEDAERWWKRSLELDARLESAGLLRPEDLSRRFNTFDNYAQMLERVGRLEESEETYRRAIEGRRELAGRFSENLDYRRELVQTLNNITTYFARNGRAPEAEPFLQEAIPFVESLMTADPESPTYVNLAAATYSNLAGVRVLTGKLDEAAKLYERELETRRTLVRDHPAVVEYRLFFGSSLTNLGEVESRLGRHAGSLPYYDEAASVFQSVLDDDPRHQIGRYYLSYTYSWRASSLAALSRHRAALADWESAIALDDRGDPSLIAGRDASLRALAR